MSHKKYFQQINTSKFTLFYLKFKVNSKVNLFLKSNARSFIHLINDFIHIISYHILNQRYIDLDHRRTFLFFPLIIYFIFAMKLNQNYNLFNKNTNKLLNNKWISFKASFYQNNRIPKIEIIIGWRGNKFFQRTIVQSHL